MVGVMDVIGHLQGIQDPISVPWLIGYGLSGVVGAFASWNSMEARYKNALIEARVNAAPSGQLPSQNKASHISS